MAEPQDQRPAAAGRPRRQARARVTRNTGAGPQGNVTHARSPLDKAQPLRRGKRAQAESHPT